MKRHWQVLAAMLAVLPACSSNSMGGDVCTASFAMVAVKVVDGAGQPVEGATVSAVLVRTGQTLVPTSLALMVPGTYPLADDGSTSIIRRSGDAVRAHIAKGSASLTADYVLAVPDGCHISKVSGPETVTLQ